jgi:superfamily I DNA and RNA helicase
LEQFCSILIGRLLKSKTLRKGRTQLKLDVIPVIYCDHQDAAHILEGCSSEIVTSIEGFLELLEEAQKEPFSTEELNESRSVLEGAKALTRTGKRIVENPEQQRAALALSHLEAEIANFDQKQRRAALVVVNGPQRIRGLAGSGKTVILAMKAAHLHMSKPSNKILVTFFTKSLRSQIKDLITKFYRHYKEVDPDWENIHIRHGWGGSQTTGSYADASRRAGRTPLSYSEAVNSSPRGTDPFDYACDDLLKHGKVEAYYDHILIDEGQDFPTGFYKLCFELAKGERDDKNIVWAYDELQNILNVRMPSSDELFGRDTDLQPKISLERAGRKLPTGATNDTVLSKCYRNQREVLVMAHALGFGIYSDIVQLLESPDHWRDVGYELEPESFEVGSRVDILRPAENSPISITTAGTPDLIDHFEASNFEEEIEWIVQGIVGFLAEGLSAEDIIVIALDDKNMRSYFRRISAELSMRNIETNNIHSDPYSEPAFSIPGKVTLSTVYRAKGNEAAVVFAVGLDALSLKLRGNRNKIFAAFTRTKAWLRISGCGVYFKRLTEEIRLARENFPRLIFTMPNLTEINLIQRDLSERSVRAKKIRSKYLDDLKREGFTDDEVLEILSADNKHE